ncbi:uncharacterized protein KD926_005525 [Aspergillus affinis]|uniref:uncharacterized protein n=1 Tax=Aspergillus affinis TaxID=1070780 RepID=UPI0022FDC6BA|nr:uncharacterized protein KD926_005525 [Aspergillus affinis]KAI9042446.1 hypothetical protein KD926_005525 [Aspergillus affinis]
MYPLPVLALLYLLRATFAPVLARIIPRSAAEHNSSSLKTGTNTRAENKAPTTGGVNAFHLYAVQATAILTLVINSAIHLFIVGLSISTLLFPSIFHPSYVNEFRPSSLFLPPLAPGPKALTPGDGVRGFLLWDHVVTYSTVLVVVCLELRNAFNAVQGAGSNKTLKLSAWSIGSIGLVISLVMGPGSACLVASWARDEILFGNW